MAAVIAGVVWGAQRGRAPVAEEVRVAAAEVDLFPELAHFCGISWRASGICFGGVVLGGGGEDCEIYRRVFVWVSFRFLRW